MSMYVHIYRRHESVANFCETKKDCSIERCELVLLPVSIKLINESFINSDFLCQNVPTRKVKDQIEPVLSVFIVGYRVKNEGKWWNGLYCQYWRK